MNTTVLNRLFLALATATTLLTGPFAHAQNNPSLAPAITNSLVERAEENGFIDWDEYPDWIGLTANHVLEDMVGQLLADEPEPVAMPRNDDEFWSLNSGIAQELILELVQVRTTGTSDYLSPATVNQVRQPAVNDALIRLLVRSLR